MITGRAVKMQMCDLQYEEYQTQNGYGTRVARCIPHEGVFLYEIKATYAKQVPPTVYYYLGHTEQEAKERFNNIMGSWMKIVVVRLIPPGNEADAILSDPYKMPMR